MTYAVTVVSAMMMIGGLLVFMFFGFNDVLRGRLPGQTSLLGGVVLCIGALMAMLSALIGYYHVG